MMTVKMIRAKLIAIAIAIAIAITIAITITIAIAIAITSKTLRSNHGNHSNSQVCTSLAKVAADSILQGRERRESQE